MKQNAGIAQSAHDVALGVHTSVTGRTWRWRLDQDRTAAAIAQRHGVPELVARVLAGRGIGLEDAAAALEPTLRQSLPDPSLFLDMGKAAETVAEAIRRGAAIVVFGDYDVDGATSSALLLRFIQAAGGVVSAYIPDRLLEGYGPSADALLALKAAGADLVITVDCGAQAFAALEAAAAAGLPVVVIDHHKTGTSLPPALAHVNPNRFDEEAGRAYGAVAAVGMAFLLAVAVNRTLKQAGWFQGRPAPDLMSLLDLVALGTVCDVVPLTGLNRAFVTQGLKVLARRETLGLAVLADVAGITKAPDAGMLGFHLGPRINAGGRVGKADLGVKLLTTTDPVEARALAEELDRLNQERRALEALIQDEALEQARHCTDAVAVLAGEGWHPGVIGIVASRIKDALERPALIIGLDGALGKGSGRSIAGVDLGAAVIAARDAGVIEAGGGHAMAAGLTVRADQVAQLRVFLNERLAPAVAAARADRAIVIDAVLAVGGCTGTQVAALAAAGPFGSGWPAPRIAVGPARLIKADPIGDGSHVRAILSGPGGGQLKLVGFRIADSPLGQALLGGVGRDVYALGRLQADDWSGGDKAELHIEDLAFAGESGKA